MLEPLAMKVARAVLRGGDGSNAISLPDQQRMTTRGGQWQNSKQYGCPEKQGRRRFCLIGVALSDRLC